MTLQKYVVTTRPIVGSEDFIKQIETLGLRVFSFPSIATQKASLTPAIKKVLTDLRSFDIIIFTSKNGVKFFIEALQELGVNERILQNKFIAAVGPKTADIAKEFGLSVHFIPSEFTTADLAKEIPLVKGKKILLPRANIATPLLTEELKKRGATVTNIAIYTTTFNEVSNKPFEKLLKNNQIKYLTFTSSSTVNGFIKNIEGIEEKEKIFSQPAIAIGPVTSITLKEYGFTNITTADEFTLIGIFNKLKENTI